MDTPRVLVVCTANICRSPAAARLLGARLGPSVEVVSRGVRAVEGAPICEASAQFAMIHGGLAGSPHAAAQLTVADVRASTVVLTASRRQRSHVIELRPSAQVRTFTLAQAARIGRWRYEGGHVPGPDELPDVPDRLLWLIEELDAYRGAAPRGDDRADDLPDPHTDQAVTHQDVLPTLLAAADVLAALINPHP